MCVRPLTTPMPLEKYHTNSLLQSKVSSQLSKEDQSFRQFPPSSASGKSTRVCRTVYLAVHEPTNQQHAMKRIKLRDFTRRRSDVCRLEREISHIRHLDIVGFVEALHDRTATKERRECRDGLPCASAVVRETVESLRTVHENGFVRQDVKLCCSEGLRPGSSGCARTPAFHP
jgi:hypothetical protein